MTPASKEELYLAKLCGENWKLPYPTSRLEYYYAKLCGMNVPLPAEPLSRPEMYLACLCGISNELPQPLSRREMYMARACGMDVERMPEPLSKAERYWAILVNDVQKFIGKLPLVFKGNGAPLTDYTIYGVASENDTMSCGIKTKNLLPPNWSHYGVIDDNGTIASTSYRLFSDFCSVQSSHTYTVAINGRTQSDQLITINRLIEFDANKIFLKRTILGPIISTQQATFTISENTAYIVLDVRTPDLTEIITPSDIITAQVELGSTFTSFEPYGYKLPIISRSQNGDSIITPIYIGESPLHKNEQINHRENKRYNADHTSCDLSTPDLPTFDGITVLNVDANTIVPIMHIQLSQ